MQKTACGKIVPAIHWLWMCNRSLFADLPFHSPSSMVQISSMLDIISVSVIAFISEQICLNQQFLHSSKHLSYWQFRISIANSDLVQIIFIGNLLVIKNALRFGYDGILHAEHSVDSYSVKG
jgi:hypothetical protein